MRPRDRQREQDYQKLIELGYDSLKVVNPDWVKPMILQPEIIGGRLTPTGRLVTDLENILGKDRIEIGEAWGRFNLYTMAVDSPSATLDYLKIAAKVVLNMDKGISKEEKRQAMTLAGDLTIKELADIVCVLEEHSRVLEPYLHKKTG